MRRWSRCRKAYSGVGSSCPNGILLTLVTSGAKYRSGSNIHGGCVWQPGQNVLVDGQTDGHCSCADAPFRSGSSPGLPDSRGHPATGQPGLWIQPQGEMWDWSGFGHISWRALLAAYPGSLGLSWFKCGKGLTPVVKKLQGIVIA